MEVESYSGAEERRVLIALIVDNEVCSRVTSKWPKFGGLFASRYANIVGEMCVKYFRKYNKAPGKAIKSVFVNWAANNGTKDKTTTKLVDELLTSLSNKYKILAKESNSAFIADLASQHFRKVAAEKLVETVHGSLKSGELEKAEKLITSYNRLEMGTGECIDVFQDKAALQRAFEYKREALIKYPGAAGEFFGDALERDGFIAYYGFYKRGKCLSGATLIQFTDGRLVPIKEVVENKLSGPVLALNEKTLRFEPVSITEWFDNGKKPCVEIVTKSGREIVATLNHQFLSPDGWKEINQFTIGEFVAVPKKLPAFGSNDLKDEAIRYIAHMLADGCNGIVYTKNDPAMVSDFVRCSKLLGFSVRRGKTDKDVNLCAVSTGTEAPREFARKYGFYGIKSRYKEIPIEILSCPKSKIKMFLQTLFSGDGWISKTNSGYEIGIGFTSRKMTKQVSRLLIRFGIVHRFSKKVITYKGKPYSGWNILIRDKENANKFLKRVGFLPGSLKDGYTLLNLEGTFGRRSFLDMFPWQVAERFFYEAREECRKKAYANRKTSGKGWNQGEDSVPERYAFGKFASPIRYRIEQKAVAMRQSFSLARKDLKTTKKYMNSHVLWDEIVSIREVGKKKVYDITIPKFHNFATSDFIAHNSFFLIDLAYRGVLQRRKVIMFQCGDLSEHQVMKRIAVRVAGKPMKKGKTYKFPKAMTKDEDGKIHVEFEERESTKDLDWREGLRAFKKACESKIKSNESYFKLSVHPARTLSVAKLKDILREQAAKDWQPDVVIIDYPDIMDMSREEGDPREKITQTWLKLRGLAQESHCLVVVATQIKASGAKAQTIDESHFADDSRKLAHVTGTIGINRNKEDAEQGLYRLSWVNLREDELIEGKHCYMASCLAIANPCVLSSW